jgi:purine-nucleoside phosphorylase
MLGIEQIIITNASGGIDASYENGDIVVVEDHINMMPENPLRGENDERLGDRFPDMSEPYDKRLRNLALELGSAHQLPVKSGVYVGWPGPNLETPAEYRFLNMIGATVVGMSTVPEVIVARHAGIRVLVLSVVSNVCFPPDRIKETSLEDVIATVRAASAHMRKLLSLLISRI